MAIFPEDHKIRISRIVNQWVAEGILKPNRSRCLEEIAEDNLKDLIGRNLIKVQDYGSRNKIKTCTMHDLLRELGLREAQKEKFVCYTMTHSLDNHTRTFDNNPWLIRTRRSVREFAKPHTLREVLKRGYICSDGNIVGLVNSRLFDFKARYFPDLLNNILESLSLLWNLQTVTIAGSFSETPINLPAEIWEMPQLRHLKWEQGELYLPDPPSTNSTNGRRDIIVLINLQTLCKIRNFRCTDEVVVRIPNLKKLGITYWLFPSGFGWDCYKVYNLAHLRNLESLFFESEVNVPPNNLRFPRSLKKLTLRRCGLCWEDLTVVGSLPHLEVLNLMDYAVKGRKWNPVEGQFLELKSLRICFTDLEEWIADSSHFPRLEKLQLVSLFFLKEIPYGIGEIPTLQSISLSCCSDSTNSSAEKIKEEQQNFGNFDLDVRVRVH
ncbi:putative late blight resistance protein homolog R1B-16 [Primulina huaijiensis]|uniref:putative late blight resistance protein homolog R1B-16 n=1 Tax=Primulina huaijiensis TaxID=1492673 RepID=UPI003CC73C3C